MTDRSGHGPPARSDSGTTPRTDGVSIDHVTIAGSSLAELETAFSDAGIDPEYGGEHDGLPTHMSIVGFEDGTYLELIAKAAPETAPFWDDAMENDAGPCAWAARSADLDADIARLRENGIAVDGPHPYTRDRPDGEPAEWRLAFLGDGEPGKLLPFLIEDVTPRERRVSSTPSAAEAGLTGIETVVLAVEDVDAAVDAVRRAFDAPDPDRLVVDAGPFAGTVVAFGDLPAVFVEPNPDDPLAERLAAHGPGPCGFVVETDDPETARERFGAADRSQLGAREVDVIEPDCIGGIEYLCLGVDGAPSDPSPAPSN
ncbi:VOC family protein [Halobacteria archaeon AArc-dxtr1]|nr:VOC family protein [Halobacteria archaeon AArc-dxtr1]